MYQDKLTIQKKTKNTFKVQILQIAQGAAISKRPTAGEVINPMYKFPYLAFSLNDFWDLQKAKHECSKKPWGLRIAKNPKTLLTLLADFDDV